MERFAKNLNLSNGAVAIVAACFLTLPGLRVSAENPYDVRSEVTAPQNINIKGRIIDQNGQPVISEPACSSREPTTVRWLMLTVISQ